MNETDLRVDWRKPIAAVAEETYWTEPSEDGSDQPRRAIRWHVSEEGLGRIRRMEACWDCLTGFPARPCKENWRIWRDSGFNWLHSISDSRKLVYAGRCPFCKSEISPEMLALQLDTDWTEEDEALKRGKELALQDERERFERADLALARSLGLIDAVAPPSRGRSVKRRGEL